MTLDASRLTVDVQEGARWRRTLAVTVPADLVSDEREKIVRSLAGRLKLPGFRSGRIPARVVEQRYGPALNREMVDQVVGEAYREALRMQGLHPISEGEIDDLTYEAGEPLSFRISFDVRPEVELGRLGGFVVERPRAEVGDEDVDRVLQRLREQNGTWTPADEGRPETGDLVSIRVVHLVEGEPDGDPREYELVLGEGDAIPDIEAALHTLAPGDDGEFDVTFPDDFADEARRGQGERLRIRLDQRKTRVLPELDDAFARSLGDFEDVATLRARIRQDLEKEAAEQAEGAVRGQLLARLAEANPFEVPATMVERYLQSVLGDGDNVDPERLEEARARVRPEAERAVKRILLVERVADTQGLRATDEELDTRVEEIAARNDASPAEIYARLQKSGRLEQVEMEITERKVFEFLTSKSEIKQAD
jgi:trigger factor